MSILLTAIVLSSAVLFQNCSNVTLEESVPSVMPHHVRGTVELCLDQQLENFTMESIILGNMNFAFSRDKALEDTDADGIADVEEFKYGFDPLRRRSNAQVLDSICLDIAGKSDCVGVAADCDESKANALGLNDCDVKALRLDKLYGHPTQGLDSDKDGVVDILEVLRGTSANIDDLKFDPDHDGVDNWTEYLKSTNPNYSNRSFDQGRLLEYSVAQKAGLQDCNGERWELDVKRIPLAEVDAFEEPAVEGKINFSHDKNENIVVIFVKLKPSSGHAGNSKIYFMDFKINRSLTEFKFNLSDFKLAGEVLP